MRRTYANKTMSGDGEVGTILYWDGHNLNKIHYTQWASSYGTPVAVCVIPSSHNVYGNGNAGWLAVHGVNADGSHATSEQRMAWGTYNVDAGLTKYTKVPTWTNDGSTSTGSSSSGYLPSDAFTDKTPCNGDITAQYYSTGSSLIPSPYINGERRADYYRTIDGNNRLSDFNGKQNTAHLVTLGADYKASIACNLYSDSGLPAGSWYLPACGELGYVVARKGTINAALAACGGVPLSTDYRYWSSSEYSVGGACDVRFSNGYVGYSNEDSSYCVRSFVQLL